MGFLSRKRREASIREIAEAYSQTDTTTPAQERRLASQYPDAWASGKARARAYWEQGDQLKIAASDARQRLYTADMHLTEIPGTPEASAFIASFLRAIESLVQSGAFKARLLRERADQLDDMDQMRARARQTWEAAQTLADDCIEEYGATFPTDATEAQAEAWVKKTTKMHVEAAAEAHQEMTADQLQVIWSGVPPPTRRKAL